MKKYCPVLRYDVIGAEGARPIVFLHGFMGSCEDWADVVDVFQRDHLCVAIDLPGHGRSLRLASPEDYGFEAAVCGVLRVIRERGLRRPVLAGYSMGGRVALAAALRRPGEFSGLLLESASPGLASKEERDARTALDDDRAMRLEQGLFDRFLRAWYAHPLFGSLARDPALRDRLIEDRTRNVPAELARALRGLSTGRQPSLWNELRALAPPALFLAGALDEGYTTLAISMADLCPRGRDLIVPDAGHNVHRERPGAFIDALRAFLQESEEDTRGSH